MRTLTAALVGGILLSLPLFASAHGCAEESFWFGHPSKPAAVSGISAALIWTFTKAGRLQYGCHVPGHYAVGMFGQIIVR